MASTVAEVFGPEGAVMDETDIDFDPACIACIDFETS